MTGQATGFSDLGFASVPAIKQYLQAAEACGVDCAPLLEAANIHPDVLKDNNKRISGKAMEGLLALLIPASNDPCFGLHASRFIEPASYSVLGYININSSTLREVLANTAIYEKIVGDMGVSSTHIEDGMVLQSWNCRFSHPLVRRHVIENVLASWQTFIREFAHLDSSLADCIWLEPSPPPDPKLLKDYTEVFGHEVLFDQRASGIRFREELLDEALPQADRKLLKTLLDHATQLLNEIDRDQPISVRVKNLLRLMLKDAPHWVLIARQGGCCGVSHSAIRWAARRLPGAGTRLN